jgi:nitrate/nitrite transporter NarK
MTRPWAIFGVWSFAFLLSYFFRSANAVLAPELRASFELDAASLGLMTSAFFAAVALAQLPLGMTLDRWGPRRVVPVTMLAGVAGALVFGAATDLAALTAGRALLGLGFAGVLMGALHAFGRWFPERRFATVSGLFLALGTVGGLLAGTPLAWIAEAFGWRPVFLVGAAVIAAAAGTIAFASRDAPALLGSPAARAPITPPAPAPVGSLATVLRDPRFWRIALLDLFCVGTFLAVQALWAGAYLADVHGLPPVAVGDLVLVMALGVAAGNLASGAPADHSGRRRVVLAFGSGFVACHLALAFAGPGTPVAALTALFLAFGVLASFGVVLFADVRAVFPTHLAARALTAVNLAGIGGAMLVQWGMGVIIELGRDAGGGYGIEAYRPAFLVTAVLGVVAVGVYVNRTGFGGVSPLAREGRMGHAIQV